MQGSTNAQCDHDLGWQTMLAIDSTNWDIAFLHELDSRSSCQRVKAQQLPDHKICYGSASFSNVGSWAQSSTLKIFFPVCTNASQVSDDHQSPAGTCSSRTIGELKYQFPAAHRVEGGQSRVEPCAVADCILTSALLVRCIGLRSLCWSMTRSGHVKVWSCY